MEMHPFISQTLVTDIYLARWHSQMAVVNVLLVYVVSKPWGRTPMAIPCTYNFQGTHWSQILFLIDLQCKGMGCEMTHLTIRTSSFPFKLAESQTRNCALWCTYSMGHCSSMHSSGSFLYSKNRLMRLHVPLSNFHRNEQSPATMLHLLYAG